MAEDNKLVITLSLDDKASKQVANALKNISKESDNFKKKNTDSTNEANKNFLRLSITIGGVIKAYNLLSRGIVDVIDVGRRMDSGFNRTWNNFEVSVLRVQSVIAQKLIPPLTTALDFWTQLMNKSGGSANGFNSDLKKAEDNLQSLQIKLKSINSGNYVHNIFNDEKVKKFREEVSNQIIVEERNIASLKKILDAQSKRGGNELENMLIIKEATNILTEYTRIQKENEVLFLTGKMSAEAFFQTLGDKSVEDMKAKQYQITVMREIADLESFVNNQSLIEFTRTNDAKRKALTDLKTVALLTTEQIVTNAQGTIGRLSSALNSAGQNNKAFAKAAQAIAIAEATINTAVAITRARSSAPPPLNYILAGIEAAAGAIQIATIASQKFAVGTPNVPSDMTAQIHRGETIIPTTFAESIRRGELSLSGGGGGAGGGDISIALYGVTINSKENVRELAEELGFEIDRKFRNARSRV